MFWSCTVLLRPSCYTLLYSSRFATRTARTQGVYRTRLEHIWTRWSYQDKPNVGNVALRKPPSERKNAKKSWKHVFQRACRIEPTKFHVQFSAQPTLVGSLPSQMQVRPFPHSAPPPSQPFPPTPLTRRPPTFVTSTPHPPSIPASQPSQPSPPTQPCPPTPPHRSSPSHHSSGSPSGSTPGSANIPTCSTHARIYTFDLNEHWQPNKDHYDNQKINGLGEPLCYLVHSWSPIGLVMLG